MVVIDENDVGKTREEVLMDLIYEGTGERIPLDKVKFGKPSEVDQRLDRDLDPNTFIPCQVNQEYDARYWVHGSGFLYRRRCIIQHTAQSDFSKVRPIALPFKILDVLDQINEFMPYPIGASDVINYEYKTIEEVHAGITLRAAPESLLWIRGKTFTVDTSALEGGPLIQITDLDGFNEWSAPN